MRGKSRIKLLEPSLAHSIFSDIAIHGRFSNRAQGFFFAPLLVLIQGFVTVPFREYWTSPYSSHYRPYTIHGWVMWPMGTSVMTHVIPWCRGAVSVLSTMPFESVAARGTLRWMDPRCGDHGTVAPWRHGSKTKHLKGKTMVKQQ